MKKREKILLFTVLLGLSFGGFAQAIEIRNPIDSDTFAELVDKVIGLLWRLSIVIVPLMIIVSGFYFVTSVGDPDRIKTAKNIILYTVIGFSIIALASTIIAVLEDVLGI